MGDFGCIALAVQVELQAPPQNRHHRADRQNQRDRGNAQQDGPPADWLAHLFGVDFCDQVPGGARHGTQRRKNRRTPVVHRLHIPLASLHRHRRRRVAGERNPQAERGIGMIAQR